MFWRNNKFTSIYTDHVSIEVILSGMTRRKTLCVKSSTWNLGKPEGWKVYHELTNKAADRIDDIVQNNNIDVDVSMKRIETIDNEIKFTAFGKTRVKTVKAKARAKNILNKIDLLKRQSEKIENEVLKIKSKYLGRVGNVFKMKEVITGPKKGGQEPSALEILTVEN